MVVQFSSGIIELVIVFRYTFTFVIDPLEVLYHSRRVIFIAPPISAVKYKFAS